MQNCPCCCCSCATGGNPVQATYGVDQLPSSAVTITPSNSYLTFTPTSLSWTSSQAGSAPWSQQIAAEVKIAGAPASYVVSKITHTKSGPSSSAYSQVDSHIAIYP